MARIPQYHQDQLAKTYVGAGNPDQSGSMLANSILSNSGQLADTIQSSERANQQGLNRNVLTSAGDLQQQIASSQAQTAHDTRVAQAHQRAIFQVQREQYDKSLASANAPGLAFMLSSLKSGLEDAHKNDPYNVSETYQKVFPDAVKNHLDSLPMITPGARALLEKQANATAVNDTKGFEDFVSAQQRANVVAANVNGASQIQMTMSTFNGGDPQLKILSTGMDSIGKMYPGMAYELGDQKAKQALHQIEKDSIMGYMNRMIDQNPQQAKQMLEAEVFKNAKIDGSDLLQLNKDLDAKLTADQKTLNEKADLAAVGVKQSMNTQYIKATDPNTTPDEKDAAVRSINDIVKLHTGNSKSDLSITDFGLSLRDKLDARKTESEKAAREAKQLENENWTVAQRKREAAALEHKQYIATPENMQVRLKAADAFAVAASQTNKADLALHTTQLNKAFDLLNKEHDTRDKNGMPLISDDVFVVKHEILNKKQQQLTQSVAGKQPPGGIQGWIRDSEIPGISNPGDHYYDTFVQPLPDGFLKSKGAFSDPDSALHWHSRYESLLVKNVNEYKRTHDNAYPTKNELNIARKHIIDQLSAEPVD